mmetsp:Transcript_490/g.650  ORF Transcript_490/g.650 Transcript_490/m.650 type:complete len:91 (-) Transcript_490:52-324(-)
MRVWSISVKKHCILQWISSNKEELLFQSFPMVAMVMPYFQRSRILTKLTEQDFKQQMSKHFKKVKLLKPQASRKNSNECFYLCTMKQNSK